MYRGEKVKLRAYHTQDLEVVTAYINDPEVKRFLTPGVPYPIPEHEELAWLKSQSAFKDSYSFAIEVLETKKYIGGCGVNQVDWKNRKAEVGIFIGDKEKWGKGYGTDAMKVLVAFIFEQMNLNKVCLKVYGFNERAIKSYEKCGFQIEGRLREEIFKDGQYYDELYMGILREEFQKKGK